MATGRGWPSGCCSWALAPSLFGIGESYPRCFLVGMGPKAASAFAYVVLGFSALWTIGVLATDWSNYSTLRGALQRGNAEVVEGRIEEFTPMPSMGKGRERFHGVWGAVLVFPTPSRPGDLTAAVVVAAPSSRLVGPHLLCGQHDCVPGQHDCATRDRDERSRGAGRVSPWRSNPGLNPSGLRPAGKRSSF